MSDHHEMVALRLAAWAAKSLIADLDSMSGDDGHCPICGCDTECSHEPDCTANKLVIALAALEGGP